MTITIQIKEVYGLPVAYPVDDNARIFASMVGNKTLTLKTIKYIRQLGYNVVVKQPELSITK